MPYIANHDTQPGKRGQSNQQARENQGLLSCRRRRA